MLILIAVLWGSLLTSPVVFAADETSPPAVELDVNLPYQEGQIVDLSGEAIQVSPDEPVEFRLYVFEPGNRDLPVSVEDPAGLLQIEGTQGGVVPERLDGWNEIRPGTYQASYVFKESGTFLVTVLPAIENRADLPEGSTDWAAFEVAEGVAQGGPAPGEDELDGGAVVAMVALVVAVGLLVVAATHGRPRVRKEPVVHDTWWNSP